MISTTDSSVKVCSICTESKPVESFSGRRCRECRTAIAREKINSDPVRLEKRRQAVRKWHAENPEESFARYRKAHLKYEYNLTPAQYDEMLGSQNGVCAICKNPETKVYKNGRTASLAVDHCHSTGKVRGLLCEDCNQSIGKFKDDYKMLYAAYEYLSIHQMEESI